jgi:nucleoside-diphosphate-sugar epimerase
MNKASFLITGGAGYLGCVLTEHLLDGGHEVTCLDNLRYGQNTPFIHASNPDYRFVQGDARDEGVLREVLPGIDVIIPMAAIVGMPACKAYPKDAQSINYEAVMLINRLRSPKQKMIYPTSNSGYGTVFERGVCDEESPLEPISLYGRTKVDAERDLLASGKDVISLRLATTFGLSARMRLDLLVNDFVYKALTDGYVVLYEGGFKRNFIHVRDVARAFEHCFRNWGRMRNQAYNVGLESENISKLELAQRIREHVGSFEIISKEIGEDPDRRNYVVSNRKIMKSGFKPKVGLDWGIDELIRGIGVLLRNNPFRNA